MFTGIITDRGRIAAVEPHADTRVFVTTGYDAESINLGASIACSGVCLTVVARGAGALIPPGATLARGTTDTGATLARGTTDTGATLASCTTHNGAALARCTTDIRSWFAADVSAETIERTSSQLWTVGRLLNLERALKIGDELGGHIVTGHVDGTGTITAIDRAGGSFRVTVRTGPAIAPFVAAKGSITVDGVSLTVNAVNDVGGPGGDAAFEINIIPHTAAVTSLGALTPRQQVNLEIDVLARYLSRMEQYRAA